MHEKCTYHRLWEGIFTALLAVVFAFVPGLAIAETATVTTAEELIAQLGPSGTAEVVQLGQSGASRYIVYSLPNSAVVGRNCTLDLAGMCFSREYNHDCALQIGAGKSLVIVDSVGHGAINSIFESTLFRLENEASLKLRGGTYREMHIEQVESFVDDGYVLVENLDYLTARRNVGNLYDETTYTVAKQSNSNGIDFAGEDWYTCTASTQEISNEAEVIQKSLGVTSTAKKAYKIALQDASGASITSGFGTLLMNFSADSGLGLTSSNFLVALVDGDTATDLSANASCSNGVVTLRVGSLPESATIVLAQKTGQDASHTISFDAHGGKGTMAKQAVFANTATKLNKNTFTRDDYSFNGWNTAGNGSGVAYADEASISVDSDLTLYAQWVAKTYTVVFNKNGGSGSMDNQTIDRGASTALNKNEFTRSGYAFVGWNTKANGKGTSYANKEKVKNLAAAGGSINLYAQWEPYYTVEFKANGGSGSMKSQEIAVNVTERLTPNAFTRSGYAFVGWNTKADGSGVAYTDYQEVKSLASAGGNVTLYAQWSSSMPIYRLYNPNSGEHFFTGSEAERAMVEASGWRYEAVAWKAPANSSAPIFRLYNPNGGDHHYTMSAGERDLLVKEGWRYEGIALYSDTVQTVPIYRAYNPNAKTGAHNFTADAAEQAYVVSVGWRNEGIAWYGVK